MKGKINVAFTGPESSGKSTLSLWLAESIHGIYCQEFARNYLADKKTYNQNDLLEIAKGQLNVWANAESNKPIVADTELIVLEIWSKWKFKSCDDFITSQIIKQSFDVYFLCKPDIPWIYDPLRESPNDRDELFTVYFDTLTNYNFNFFVLEGSLLNRQQLVKQVLTNYGLFF
jgi:nicotinamide riboside kinase